MLSMRRSLSLLEQGASALTTDHRIVLGDTRLRPASKRDPFPEAKEVSSSMRSTSVSG
jgi:hypothetical protein